MKLVKFIRYYSQFKPLKMYPQRQQEILQRLSDSMDTDLDYSKVMTDDSREHPKQIKNWTYPVVHRLRCQDGQTILNLKCMVMSDCYFYFWDNYLSLKTQNYLTPQTANPLIRFQYEQTYPFYICTFFSDTEYLSSIGTS